MLALCARHQMPAVGLAMKDIQSPIVGEDGSPSSPPERAMSSTRLAAAARSPPATRSSPRVTRRRLVAHRTHLRERQLSRGLTLAHARHQFALSLPAMEVTPDASVCR